MDGGESWRVVPRCDPSPKKLILAAAECAEDKDAPPPPELILAWRVQRWGAAAVFDGELPAMLLNHMTVALNTYSAFESYKAGSSDFARWAESNPLQFAIVAEVREMRKHAN